MKPAKVNYRPAAWVSPFDRLFNEMLPGEFFRNTPEMVQRPLFNVVEQEDAYRIELATPGMKKEDFQLRIDKDQLVITAKREESKETKEANYHRREFSSYNFERRFGLPETVDQEHIQASYEDGVLNVHLPKLAAAKTPEARTIVVA